MPRNQRLYTATVQALTDRGCPEDLANQAASVVANDDSGKPNLGRTEADQAVVKQALPYLQK
ncbi:hypothetical protein LC593_35200 [Nostoc sp. CHAB 5844]|nr:hypothetical protein [Nostoc sp. CHAB 5844]